jgi:hypothetical protein
MMYLFKDRTAQTTNFKKNTGGANFSSDIVVRLHTIDTIWGYSVRHCVSTA